MTAQCPLVAFFGPAAISELSTLSGIKRKLDIDSANRRFWGAKQPFAGMSVVERTTENICSH
jgi:hypothetical protein